MNSEPTRFTLRQLELFTAAERTGSFSAAALEQSVTPSAVSVAVRELERSLGTTLLLRRPSAGVTATPAGEGLALRARVLLQEAVELQRYVLSGEGPLRGPIALGCFVPLVPVVAVDLLDDFSTRHPGIELRIVDDFMTGLLRQLYRGELDLVVGYRIGIPADLEQVWLHDTTAQVLLRADHPLAARTEITPQDLAGEDFLVFDQPPIGQHAVELLTVDDLSPRVKVRTPNIDLLCSLIERGHGYSLLMRDPDEERMYRGLPIVTRPLAAPHARQSVVAMWPKGQRLTERARALVDWWVAGRDPAGAGASPPRPQM